MRPIGVLVLVMIAGCRERSPATRAGPADSKLAGASAAPDAGLAALVHPGRPLPGGALDGVLPGATREQVSSRLPCAGQGEPAACRLGGFDVTVAYTGLAGSRRVGSVAIALAGPGEIEGDLTRRWGPGQATLESPGIEGIAWHDDASRIRAVYVRADAVAGPRLEFRTYRDVQDYLAVRDDGSLTVLPRIGEPFAGDPAAPYAAYLRDRDEWGAVLELPPTPRAPRATTVRLWLDDRVEITDYLVELDAPEPDAVRGHFERRLGPPTRQPDGDALVFHAGRRTLVLRIAGHHVAIYHGPDPPRWP